MGESFRNHTVWQRAVELTLAEQVTATFPDSSDLDFQPIAEGLRVRRQQHRRGVWTVHQRRISSDSWGMRADLILRLKRKL